MSVPVEYREMLRTALKSEKQKEQNGSDQKQKRRRKRHENALLVTPEPQTPKQIHHNQQEQDPPPTSDRLRKIKEALEKEMKIQKQQEEASVIELSTESEDEPEDDEPKPEPEPELEKQSSDVDFNSDDFEDIDIPQEELASDKIENSIDNEPLTIKIKKSTLAPTKKRKSRPTVISSEERFLRRDVHVLYLFVMVSHGKVRNQWISDEILLNTLRDQLPNSLKREYLEYEKCRKDSAMSTGTRTRKLLDFLRHLMNYWTSIWSNDANAPVIYKKTWSEICNKEYPFEEKKKLKLAQFRDSITSRFGSRDLSAQGFCSLLRSLSLPARLVFSLQPPDFTNMIECKVLDERREQSEQTIERPKKKPKVSQKDRILEALKPTKIKNKLHIDNNNDDDGNQKYGNWPVFWIEVWDKDAKKYITIDPVVKKTIEIVVNKSKLEPPMNCIRNNAWYVIGYDRLGGVRDITRRYAKEFNAKVRKKRIDRELRYCDWWKRLISAGCSSSRVNPNRVDKFEEIDFEEFNEREGMPSSISDFKSHPIYVLENDLKWNEILEPMVSCGTVRKKTKGGMDSGLLPVYKRSNVLTLRSAKGWYMRGLILKVGERPLKIYKKENSTAGKERDDVGDEEENEKRLYAERQTERYIPPPIVNGKIPTNAYKNIDIYEPWMIPEGCVHISNKEAEKAAKIMRIEYVPAVIGFDFDGGGKRRRREVKAKIQGIVTFKEYQEAVELVADSLKEQKDEDDQKRKELLILRSWRIFLTKLQIKNRLIEEHGEVYTSEEDEEEEKEIDYDEEYAGFLPSTRTRSQVGEIDMGDDDDNDDYNNLVHDSELDLSDFDDMQESAEPKKKRLGLFGTNRDTNLVNHTDDDDDEEDELNYNTKGEGGDESEFNDFMNDF